MALFAHISDEALKKRCEAGEIAAFKLLEGCHDFEARDLVNATIDGESIRPCDKVWPDSSKLNAAAAGALGTSSNSRLLEGSKSRARQDRQNSWSAIDIEAKKRLTLRLTEQVVLEASQSPSRRSRRRWRRRAQCAQWDQ